MKKITVKQFIAIEKECLEEFLKVMDEEALRDLITFDEWEDEYFDEFYRETIQEILVDKGLV